jgi:predicted RNA-binding Zn-ribbon protein involved in translation (DUF1610 family)
MAYIAVHEGQEKGAFEVPHQTDAFCPKCGERMRVWREAEDGTARHFKHVSEMRGGDSAGGGTGCSGGEGDQHRKWKNFAAERLAEVFNDVAEATVEKRLHAPHTDKDYRDADAVVTFSERDDQLGIGLAAEVQHKNHQKDIAATSRDYLKQDIAVAWLDQNDFSESGCRLNETDFRARAREIPSPGYFGAGNLPNGHPTRHHVDSRLYKIRNYRADVNNPEWDHTLEPRESHVPAKIPGEYIDEHAQRIWRQQDWEKLFRRHTQIPPGKRERMRALTASPTETRNTEVALPSEYWERLRRWYWFHSDFSEKLDPPQHNAANVDSDPVVKAAFPAAWQYPNPNNYYHLSDKNAPRNCGDCGDEATVYVHGRGFRCGDCGNYPGSRSQYNMHTSNPTKEDH